MPEIEQTENEIEESENKEIIIPKEIYDKEMELIKSNPRKYICDCIEKNLIYVGSKSFKFISLLPCSLVLPDICFNSTSIKPNFNLLMIGSPSFGKTSICNKFCNITLNPIKVKKITNSRMVERLIQDKMFSISLDDFASLFNDNDGYPKVKTLESALGDDRMLSAETMTYQTGEVRVQGVGLIGITPIDLVKFLDYLKSGLFSRMAILWLHLTKKENDNVIKYINEGIGNYSNENDMLIKEKIIKDYYQILFNIQYDKHEIKKIAGYKISNEIKNEALKKWQNIIDNFGIKESGNFKRDLHNFYRFVISSAFLNIFNREHKDGILVPNEEDLKVALELMEESLSNKLMLFQIEDKSKLLKNPYNFLDFMQKNPNMRSDVKKLLTFLSGHSNLLDKLEKS